MNSPIRHELIRLAIGIMLLLLLGRIASAQPTVDQRVIARVHTRNQQEIEQLVTLGLDLLEMRDGDDLFILTTPAQIEELRRDGWVVDVDEEQTTALRRNRPNTFMGGYRTVPEMRAFLDSQAAQYPNLAEVLVYGSSWEKLNGMSGHDLFGIKLTNRQRPGPKPTLFLMAAIHARELTTSELALRLVDYLLSGYGVDGDATWLLDEHQIVVVPAANPDGHVLAEQGYYQRKNTDPTNGSNCESPPSMYSQAGVDLNRNSSFRWGTVNRPTEDPCGQTYPGPRASSEPETTVLQNLVLSLFPDQRGPNDADAAPITTTGILLTLHSYSNLVLWPWGSMSAPAPNDAALSMIGRKFAAYNGYTAQQSIQLYPTSGTTDDWAYGALGIAAFTFEIGPSSGTCGGFFPPFTCLDGGSGGSFWPRNLPAFLYAARIARAPYQLVQGPTPEVLTATGVLANRVELRAQFDEQWNGGQAIAAAEYYVDTPPWREGLGHPMTPLDGSFNSTSETAIVSVPITGRHLFYVRARDGNGNWGPVRAVWASASTLTFLPWVVR